MLHHFTFDLLHKVLRECSTAVQSESGSLDVKLNEKEENVLRYVSGYIPFSLKNRYSKIDGKDAKIVLQVINSWRAPSDSRLESSYSFLEYTKKWVSEVNRGGLFLVNNDFYIFIRRLENVARLFFNKDLIKNYNGDDIRDIVGCKMLMSKLILEAWDTLTRNIANAKLNNLLLNIIVNKWVNLRANAFAQAWVDSLKAKYKEAAAAKGKPAMRKCLK